MNENRVVNIGRIENKIYKEKNLRKYKYGKMLTIGVSGLHISSEMGWGKRDPSDYRRTLNTKITYLK